MQILKLAIYVLAALTTCGLSHEANATSSFNLSTFVPDSAILKGGAPGDKISVEDSSVRTAPTLYSQAERTTPMGSGVLPSELTQATSFSDIQGNWAQSFIEALAARDIIQGFPDGTFRPDEPVTRAQFAAMIREAFQKNPLRQAIAFVDVPAYYWASEAIQEAYQTGFLEGYPNNVFIPNQNIPRVQVLVSLANGLDLSATQEDAAAVLDASFEDAAQIPEFARTPLFAATANRLVVNYPNVALLNPNQVATRADVAAFIYQALASTGEVPQVSAKDVAAQYIVDYKPVATAPPSPLSPEGTPSPPAPEQEAAVRQKFQVQLPAVEILRPVARRVSGGSSINSPTAFGADRGRGFMGASFQARTRYGPRPDGVAGVGFGLGNARKFVGLEIVATNVDMSDPGRDGTISFKVHRLLPNNFAIALGVENALIWGDTDGGSSIYGVASKVFPLREDPAKPFSRITASLGLGSDRFRSDEDRANNADTLNVFGSVGLQVVDQVSLIADWSGQDLYLGASIVPFRQFPLVIVPGIADVTGSAYGDGGRFILGVGYGFSF